ncbi:MAG: DinB family protein [Lewinellaceae bacterium]|nr:DinB family protein [Saprospiraceae bacterium]MCB9312220.1 DinB family protein [Lewinellaceae bacterium]HRW75733.1 DinB family protein [Saprospiraceae bacterium]
MIQTSFALMRQTRTNFLQMVHPLSIDQLNRIPPGFGNNLVWNFGHMVVTLPLLTYGLSGLPIPLDEGMVGMYRRGSSPEGPVSREHWEHLQLLSEESLAGVQADYEAGVFQAYQPYTTTYGARLQSVDDAIRFAPVHEGLHLGYAMAMVKSIV